MITPESLIAKAERAIATAQNNLRDDDPDAAAGRAYYAVFNAARALLAGIANVDPETIRTHSDLISRFSEVLVRTGVFDVELSRALALLGKDRAVADYEGRMVSVSNAERDIELGRRFVAAARRLLETRREP